MTDMKQARSPWRQAMWGGAALLLALPAVAMLFTGEVRWGPEDFLAMAAMLLVACSASELAAHLIARPGWRVAAFLAVAVVFLLVWAELAVGIFH
jgi:hypothetical protein